MQHKKETCKSETFVVNMKCRQNHTWQGTVKWVEGKKEVPFRSAIELIKLMDSAMDLPDEDRVTW